MRRFDFVFVVLICLVAGCGQKPQPQPKVVPPAQTNQPPVATNEQAAAEEKGPEEKVARGEKGIAVTVDPIATRAAVEAMKKGGNAIDGVVAAALTLCVVDGFNSGIGGGCFMLIRHKNGAYNAVDGRETAPGKATRDMFMRNGKADPDLSQTGPLAAATPGALAAYDLALKKWGKLSLKEHLLAAAKIAEEGFTVDRRYAAVTEGSAEEFRRFPDSAAIFLNNGQPLKVGHVLKQPDLAKTYRNIAEHGTDWFYRGPFAKATEEWMKKNGGILQATDFMNYQPFIRTPLFTNYREYTIATMPPPSSGGIHMIQILKMCETQDLWPMRRQGVNVIHYITEAMKLAFADRAHWLGDPDFVKVPMGLISKQYCRDLAAKIQLEKAIEVPSHGTPTDAETQFFKSMYNKHTTHFACADEEGNWVAVTATVNTSFGSKVVIPGTGVVLNNEMDDFSAEPGAPNFFGLVGAEANAIEPFKRPLSSMTPTIVSKGGEVYLAVGAAGGPTIISQVAQTIINYLDMRMNGGPEMVELELSIHDALRTPRFHHQWRPDELRIETTWADPIMQDLEKKGHKLKKVGSIGACQVIARNPDGAGFIGAADPRGNGNAEGF